MITRVSRVGNGDYLIPVARFILGDLRRTVKVVHDLRYDLTMAKPKFKVNDKVIVPHLGLFAGHGVVLSVGRNTRHWEYAVQFDSGRTEVIPEARIERTKQ